MKVLFVVVALAFFGLGAVLILLGLRRGSGIVETLRQRHRELWETMGRPRPTLFITQTGIRFNQFIFQREYAKLEDLSLVRQCEALRHYDLAVLIYLITGFALLGTAALFVRG